MKKIFLVDDEAVIRRGIAQKIDWEKEGFSYCGDASDGEMALPLIEKHQPDIVITDIKMPFMDGLTLSKIIKEKMPNIKIIILSGHDEFEYAQQAIRLQVEEYCLKPVSSQDLLTILRKVKKEMEAPLIHYAKIDTKEDLYDHLCKGSLSTEEIAHQAKALQVDLMASYYTVVVVEYDEELKRVAPFYQNDQALFFVKDTKWIVILKHDVEHMLMKQINQIRESLSSVLFGIGSIETRTEHITLSYENAIEAYSYSRAVHSYTSTMFLSDNEGIYQDLMRAADRRKLIHFLKFGQLDQVTTFVQRYSDVILNKKEHPNVFIYYFLLDFTITIKHHIEETEQYDDDCMKVIQQVEEQIQKVQTKQQIVEYMTNMLLPLFSNKDTGKYAKVIQQVKQVVSERYHESGLSLQQIALDVNISASYLSNIFSKEMKQTITEYLTKTRIEKAKELLEMTNDKTYEIADKVGYNDSHYFCHIFKKITGMTTKEYKNHLTNQYSATIG
ncbi:response regulator [Gracilibacillus kekensis]|uniref:Two-component system, response regulator YesN n=1 Tax=Gracilibacillus kekensis TaxID=1027249 RepID=A0A1M7N248_9BACI|nr:response regulator [Gracilibacillus kekensis]SHM97598.1 two-component system, response regulator YesN [Gracilibacillus kekensis]